MTKTIYPPAVEAMLIPIDKAHGDEQLNTSGPTQEEVTAKLKELAMDEIDRLDYEQVGEMVVNLWSLLPKDLPESASQLRQGQANMLLFFMNDLTLQIMEAIGDDVAIDVLNAERGIQD